MTEPAYMKQVLSDLERHEGFRPCAYPDPLSKIGKAYSNRKHRWGLRPAREILKELNLNEANGRPWTVGHGFTRGVTVDTTISHKQSVERLREEVVDHVKGLDSLTPGWRTKFPLYAQTVAANLIFNMGTERLSKFDTTLDLLNSGKYATAGTNLRKTLWFKQVGDRAKELVERLESGKIAREHQV